MPNLGDYLGQLLSEISIARMQADLETVRLAELYATHPLLRTMPVPHVRLPDVELDLPVLIREFEEPRAGESARGGISPADMKKQFEKVLGMHLSKANIQLSAKHKKELTSALDERITRLGSPMETSVDVHRVADDLTSTAVHLLEALKPEEKPGDPAFLRSFSQELNEAVRLDFLKTRKAPPRLTVLVTSAEIREAGTTDNVTRLRLKVTEQGVEWTSVESNGVRRDQLVPE